MMFETSNSFEIPRAAAQRIGSFLISPQRLAPTQNINNYWLNRRWALNFTLEPGAIVIRGDSNLSTRITPRDYERLSHLRFFPGLVLAARFVRRLCSWIAGRADRVVQLAQVKQRIALGAASRAHLLTSASPELASDIKHRLKKSPFEEISKGWPERASLMAEALNVILRYAPNSSASGLRVLEIGSGPAILAGLMGHCLRSRHVLIDLPEQIVVGFSMLCEFFPEQKILLPNEVVAFESLPHDPDIVFLTPEQTECLEGERFDVAVNMFSFGEMSYETIGEYFALIRRTLKPGGIFYCANRVSKFNPHDGTTSDFDRYPWSDGDSFLFVRDMAHVFGANRGHRECVVRMATAV